MPDIHKKITAIRKIRKLTQLEVAERAHVNLNTYQRIEAGASPVTDDVLQNIAEALQCSMNDIRNFNLETAQFGTPEEIAQVSALEQENAFLKAQVS